MRPLLCSLLPLLLAACASPVRTGLPADVTAFIERRDVCDHFRGEEAYDEARRREIEARLAETCTGTDAELARLRARYRADPAVLDTLATYEDHIE